MLKKILSISGKPGLFKHISQAKNMIIVESLLDSKRFPAYSRDKIVSLGDISIFIDEGEIKLNEVYQKLQAKYGAEQIKAAEQELPKLLADVLPTYDRERVHKSDIRKLFAWYNLLVEKGLTDFSEEEEKEEEPAAV
ncbi:MAG: DUF5606 domain-containing protein [Prevotellaceae bacterium]|jgi:hypothetical protein|nr:DUF5606 domain-containing protein [Prevotellaceae bacterium]